MDHRTEADNDYFNQVCGMLSFLVALQEGFVDLRVASPNFDPSEIEILFTVKSLIQESKLFLVDVGELAKLCPDLKIKTALYESIIKDELAKL